MAGNPKPLPQASGRPMTESKETQSPADGLGAVLDEHLRWIGQWHRAASVNHPYTVA